MLAAYLNPHMLMESSGKQDYDSKNLIMNQSKLGKAE